MKSVYLAGPISGLTYNESVDWRAEASSFLAEQNIRALSPMRGKEYLVGEAVLGPMGYEDLTMSSPLGITTRDRFDVMSCDAVLMNLLGATTVSIGTMIEAGWADAMRKPIILVMEPDNLHHHAILNTVAGFHTQTLEDALYIASVVLGG